MFRLVFLLLCNFLLSISYSEAVTCYHCYDSFNRAFNMESLNNVDFNEKFVRCDKNKNNWNFWNCPAQWPVCIVMSGTVRDHYEVIRTCGKKDFCSTYVPPNGVKVDYCRECNTTLCNDYPQLPDPPVEPGPLFTFNININLNLKKYPAFNWKDGN